MLSLAVGQVNALDVFLTVNGPIDCFLAGLHAHTSRGDSDEADGHAELSSGLPFCPQNSFQGIVPVERVTAEGPVRREADFQELDILPRYVLKHFPRDPLDDGG